MKKTLLYTVLTLVLLGAIYAYTLYNKEHINVAKTEAHEKLPANQLFDAFDTDESSAMLKYSDKIVETWGSIVAIDLSNDLEPQLVLEGNGDNGFIRCGFKVEEIENVKKLSHDDSLRVKGECRGINAAEELDLLADKDVVLSNCIIIE